MKLSIIVPVYNVSKYLAKCLDSLLCQNLKPEEYEIIVVNDGSTDNSEVIARQYEKKYINIRVVCQKNQGLSGARNTGIKLAQGKYIQFVDSDDYLEPNVLKTLVDKMDTYNLDVLRFNYQNVNEEHEVYNPNKSNKPFMDYRDIICDGTHFLEYRLGYACYVVQFMFKADLIKPTVNHFKSGIYFEDVEWTPRIIQQVKKITSIELIVYNYLVRDGSITQECDWEKQKKSYENRIYLLFDFIQRYKSNPNILWYKRMANRIVLGLLNSLSEYEVNKIKPYIIRIIDSGVFPMSVYKQPWRDFSKIMISNLSPILYCKIKHMLKRFH